ncbi:MAG: peroxidase family protein, partial [Anaerolineae bacterium]|nr:peroxidase family protein [Anaerolineae bacterium]
MNPQDRERWRKYGHGIGKSSTTGSSYALAASVAPDRRFASFFRQVTPDGGGLPPHTATDKRLKGLTIDQINDCFKQIGAADGIMHETKREDGQVPAGYTFLGQFLDHDITLEQVSSLDDETVDFDGLHNTRSPALDLDSLYHHGPDGPDAGNIYEKDETGKCIGKFLIREVKAADGTNFHDLPRDAEGKAHIGDHRNDENLIISQLHLAFLKFHNRLYQALEEAGVTDEAKLFADTHKNVIYYYHKMIVDDFLPRVIGSQLLADLLDDTSSRKPRYFIPTTADEVYMPFEFSVAAYRYGHSQVRDSYPLNEHKSAELFQIGGFKRPETYVAWRYFFETDRTHGPVKGSLIDTILPANLLALPF